MTVDASDERLAEEILVLDREGYVNERWQRGLVWLRELQQLRAAKAADRERVREVVYEEAAKFSKVCMCMTDVRLQLAAAVADALAVPRQRLLNEDERQLLDRVIVRVTTYPDDCGPDAGPLVELFLRLLGATK